MIRRSIALLILLSGSCLAAPASLDCPPDTRFDTAKMRNERLKIESCRDEKTGLREGPMRVMRPDGFIEASGQYRSGKLDGEYFVFGNDGRAELRIVYDQGRKLDEKLTRLGLENTIAGINADAEKKDKLWRMSVIDDRTVNYAVRIRAPFSWIKPDEQGKQELRARLIEEPAFCALFKTLAGIEQVLVHYADGAGEELASLTVARAECATNPPNSGS